MARCEYFASGIDNYVYCYWLGCSEPMKIYVIIASKVLSNGWHHCQDALDLLDRIAAI